MDEVVIEVAVLLPIAPWVTDLSRLRVIIFWSSSLSGGSSAPPSIRAYICHLRDSRGGQNPSPKTIQLES